MKSTISRETKTYLNELEQAEKEGMIPQPFYSNPDVIDQMIIENNLQIEGLSFYPQIDLMLVVLNNKKVLKSDLSKFKRLESATLAQLENYEISPMGVHWPELDEDISLKGLLKYELAFSDSPQVA